MDIELEVVTPNLRGCCVTIDNRLHGLFKLTRRDGNTGEHAWALVRPEPHNVSVDEPSRLARESGS